MALILFLHGPSSSGKSTLAAAIREASDRPYLHLSIDHLRDSGAWEPSATQIGKPRGRGSSRAFTAPLPALPVRATI